MTNSRNNFKSILCLNGKIPGKKIFEEYNSLPIIAADGAGDELLSRGIMPNFIVGDFDSLKANINDFKNIKFIQYENQNYNDFEKCILVMRKNNFFPALVFGLFGKEIDHMINNLNCLIKHSRKFPMVFYNEETITQPQWGISVRDSISFKGNPGELISIIPHPEAIISTNGLKWNLINQKLSISGKSSIRNEVAESKVDIKIHQGIALIITNNANLV